MRLLFLSMFLVTIYTNAFSNSINEVKNSINTYNKELKICDTKYKEESNTSNSTQKMIESSYNAADCYTALIYKIINEQYSQNAAVHKEALDNYIKASYALNGKIYETPDNCIPRCGTMYVVIAKTEVAHDLKELINRYLTAINIY